MIVKANRDASASPIPSTSTASGQDAPKSIITSIMIKPYSKAPSRKSTCCDHQSGGTKILTKTPEKNYQDRKA